MRVGTRAEPGLGLGFPLPRRSAPVPTPGRRVRLTLQNDLLERLPLQPVPAPQLFRDVALPAGKVCCAEARRHADRCPGASRPLLSRADTGGCRLQRAASDGRTGAGRRNLTSTYRAPQRLSGMIFRSLPEVILDKTGRPASLRDVVTSSPEASRVALK